MAAQCNFTIPSSKCTLETCCLAQSSLNYRPTVVGNSIYAGLFGAILLAQVILLVLHPRVWGFFIGLASGIVLEIVGYAGRILLHNSPFDINNFIIYLVCLTIAPAFIMASIYLCMGRVIVAYGASYSVLRPRNYALVCIAGDVVSLVLQGLGGGIAATSAKSETNDGSNSGQLGTNILVAGLAFQLFATLVFAALSAVFAWRVVKDKTGTQRNPAFLQLTRTLRFRLFVTALGVATLLVFIRSAYRVAELQGGFSSDLANNQTEFMIFEGPMIIVACLLITIFHPAVSFNGLWEEANWSLGKGNREEQKMPVSKPVEEREMAHFTSLPSEQSSFSNVGQLR